MLLDLGAVLLAAGLVWVSNKESHKPTAQLRHRLVLVMAGVQVAGVVASDWMGDSGFAYHSRMLNSSLLLLALCIFRVEVAELYSREAPALLPLFLPPFLLTSWCFFRQSASLCLNPEPLAAWLVGGLFSGFLAYLYLREVRQVTDCRYLWHFLGLVGMAALAWAGLALAIAELPPDGLVTSCTDMGLGSVTAAGLAWVALLGILECKWHNQQQ
jgi:hypothetical protein